MALFLQKGNEMYNYTYYTTIGEGLEPVYVEVEFDRDDDSTFDRSIVSIKLGQTEISGCFKTEILDELAKKGADLYMEEIACGVKDV
jgi:hypothetical protein